MYRLGPTAISYILTFLAGLVIGLGWMLVHFCLTIGRALDNFFNLKERK